MRLCCRVAWCTIALVCVLGVWLTSTHLISPDDVTTKSLKRNQRRSSPTLRNKVQEGVAETPGPTIRIYRYKQMDRILSAMSKQVNWTLNELDPLFQFSLEKVIDHNIKRSTVLVENPEEADFFFIPFYGRMAFDFEDVRNLHNLQIKLWDATYWTLLDSQWFWRKGGADHIVVHSHTRGTFRTYNHLWELIKKCMFISFEGEGADKREGVLPFRTSKDILVPYLVQHGLADGSARRNQKKIWAHFRGSPTNEIRKKIIELQFPKNRYVVLGLLNTRLAQHTTADKAYKIHTGRLEMRQSIFCLCPGGLTPSSQRMYVAIAANCIPVIVSDDVQLPFPGLVDYTKFTVRIPEAMVNRIPDILDSFTANQIARLQQNLKIWRKQLLFNQPRAEEGDAFSLILETLARKV
eukprot:CFRG5877T1